MKAVHNLVHGSAAINQLTSQDASRPTPRAYDVTYVTTGSSPATIRFAASPPHGFAFDDDDLYRQFDVFAGRGGPVRLHEVVVGLELGMRLVVREAQGPRSTPTRLMYALYSGSLLDRLPQDLLGGRRPARGHHQLVDDVGQRVQPAVRRRHQRQRAERARRASVCVTSQGILGYVSVSAKVGRLRDQELLVLPAGFAVPAPGRGDGHHSSHAYHLLGGDEHAVCGIAGFTGRDPELLEAMLASIEHRGPDSSGTRAGRGLLRRDAAALHHRHRGRRAADALGADRCLHRVQRGALQQRRAAGGARTRRASFRLGPLRHRDRCCAPTSSGAARASRTSWACSPSPSSTRARTRCT